MRFVIALVILLTTLVSCKQKSDEVLEAFGKINERLEQANSQQQNAQFFIDQDSLLRVIKQRYPSTYTKVQKVQSKMQVLDDYLANTKKSLLTNLKDPDNYSAMDTSTEVDDLFFMGTKVSAEGAVYLQKIKQYRSTVETEFVNVYPAFVQKTKSKFNTNEALDGNDDSSQWLVRNYKGFPLIASITKMTQLQADLKTNFQDLLLLSVSE